MVFLLDFIKLFKNRLFNKRVGVSHFHSLPLQLQKKKDRKEKKRVEL